MDEAGFVVKEIKFITKTNGPAILVSLAIIIPYLFFNFLNLQKAVSGSGTLEIKTTIISNMVEATLLAIPNIVIFSFFVILMIIAMEKNDKVFEQIFVAIPLSQLKILLYHFVAFIPVLILLLAIVHLLTAIIITIITGNPYLMLVLRSFILSLILSLSLGYTLFLNEMLIPSKYASWIIIAPVILFSIQNVFFSVRQAAIESTIVYTLIASAIIGLIGLAETILLKDKVAERVITT
ncbi:MAG: hypothetical protein QXU11_00340 [Thermoproteota archaeon]